MKVCSFSSGSKGNCTYIESDGCKILIDIGINLKFLLECLNKMGVNPEDISAVIITHEHSDHIKGVESFCSKYDKKIICAQNLKEVLKNQFPRCEKYITTYSSSFALNDLKICPFELSHDSRSCFGYRVFDEFSSCSFVTDTGYLPDNAMKIIQHSPLVFLESNYDPDMLMASSYPMFLKKRIMSRTGHLSNLDCAKVIFELQKSGTRQVVLSHISENSNTPYLAYNTIKNYLESKNITIGKDINITINYQKQMNTVYKLSKR